MNVIIKRDVLNRELLIKSADRIHADDWPTLKDDQEITRKKLRQIEDKKKRLEDKELYRRGRVTKIISDVVLTTDMGINSRSKKFSEVYLVLWQGHELVMTPSEIEFVN